MKIIEKLTGDPFKINLDTNLKDGVYLIEGELLDDSIVKLNHNLNMYMSENDGLNNKASVKLYMKKTEDVFEFIGNIKAQIERECVKTLNNFVEDLDFEVEETASKNKKDYENGMYIPAYDLVPIEEVITQQISLNLQDYPTCPEFKSKIGSFDVKDGLKDEELKKNPFSVLK